MMMTGSPTQGKCTPMISVIVETYTVSHEYPAGECAIQLGSVLDRLREQSYPVDRAEIIVVLDEANVPLANFLQTRYPEAIRVFVTDGTYLSMKNRGFEVARGEILALLDGDCIPVRSWLETIAIACSPGVDAVAGKTRYRPEHPLARTFSVFDFGHVQADPDGKTFSFNVNNVAFRRDVVAQNRFDGRVRRNGGCFLFWRKLKLANCNMIYDPKMFAGHGNDCSGMGFARKHLERGFDTINLFRIADPKLLDAARYMRFGVLVPLGMFASRFLFDLRRMVTNRRDLGIRLYTVPYYYAVSLMVRGLEAIGGMIAILRPGYFGGH